MIETCRLENVILIETIFQEFFGSINEIFILVGRLGSRITFRGIWTLS